MPSRSPGRFTAALSGAALTWAAVACGAAKFPETEPPPQLPDTEAAVYLIGDAGYATPGLPILTHLKNDLRRYDQASEVVVAFLGDNIYWSGLHEPSHPDHDRDVMHLEAQIEVLRDTNAKGIFVPGNHDWGYKDERGLAQIRRQDDYIAAVAKTGVDVTFSPRAGCPGPDTVSLGSSVLVVTLETDLWLRDDAPAADCAHTTTDAALNSLSDVLAKNRRGDGRHVVVLGHHPLKTYGSHGGYFGLKDQFFPGTNLWDPLYIPFPFIYPIVRNSGITRQDMSSGRNAWMRGQFASVFGEFPEQPLVWAAGHDHNLQVFEGYEYGVGYILVSGAGSKLSNVGKDDALFAAGKQQRELGYMRLEFLTDGRVLLSVITDGRSACDDDNTCLGEPTVRYWRWLAGD